MINRKSSLIFSKRHPNIGKQHTNIIFCRGHTSHAVDSYPVCVCVTQTTIERRRFFLFPGTDLFAGKKKRRFATREFVFAKKYVVLLAKRFKQRRRRKTFVYFTCVVK